MGTYGFPKMKLLLTLAWWSIFGCKRQIDPHQIWITAGGNLINYLGELSTQTVDLTTLKSMWNSILSTEGAKYMCLDIKNFYLMPPMDWFEYMKMPVALSPKWIMKQYNLMKHHVLNGFIYLKMRWAVWGLPQAGILASSFANISSPTGIMSVIIPPACGRTKRDLSPSRWLLMILG